MANKLSVYATGISGENLKILETDGIDATKANVRVQVAGSSVVSGVDIAGADGATMESRGDYVPTKTIGSKVVGPTLIDTIPYSSFTASATLYKTYAGKCSRNAKKRTFIISNRLDQPISNSGISPYDSAVPSAPNGNGGDSTTPGIMGSNSNFYFLSDSRTSLGASVDSVQINLSMGATAPLSGNLYIYITEVF